MTRAALAVLLVLQAYLWFAPYPGSPPVDATYTQLDSLPPGCEVTLDGKSMGKTPVQLPLSGPVRQDGVRWVVRGTLTFERSGYRSETRQNLPVKAGRTSVVTLDRTLMGWLPLSWPLPLALALAVWSRRRQERSGASQREHAEAERTRESIGPGGWVGEYRLEHLRGRGATAEVYLAYPRDGQGASVAIKLLYEEACRDPEFRQRFEREAGTCTRLKHPRVIGCHAFGEKNGRLWMAQDYLPGGNLGSLIKSGLSAAQARKLLIEICAGLEHAHEAGIIHRDLKPENILLDSRHEPVIADFGLARSAVYATITKTDATLGTPAYMPPEQVMGERADARADLYSLGCIAYEMLTGRPPFEAEQPIQVIMAQLQDTPVPLRELKPSIPEDLEAIVLRCLAKDPAARYSTAAEVRGALQAG
jgi:tRNA A-37 threonylcarbamoyl transferase component Bud32